MRAAAATILVLTSGLLASLLPLRAARAGDEDRRPDETRQRIEFLVQEARVLEKEGRHDAAREFHARAAVLERRAREEKETRHRTPLRPDEARRVLRGLRAGIAALRRIHRPQEEEAVARIARELLARMRGAGLDEKKAAEGLEDREHAKAKRREAGAKKRFALLSLAAKAFHEAEKGESVERLEVAMHAMKLRLEGRRDEEAREIYEQAPNGDETRDLLRAAADIWAGMGHEEKAKALGGVTRKTSDKQARKDKAARRKAEAKAKATARAKAKAKAKRKGDRPTVATATPQKLKRLAAQIERLAKGLESLRRELAALREQTTR